MADKKKGPAPYGQRHDDNKLVPDIAEQATLDQIRALSTQGLGSVSIANTLNAQGYLCRGSKWHRNTVRRILARMRSEEPS